MHSSLFDPSARSQESVPARQSKRTFAPRRPLKRSFDTALRITVALTSLLTCAVSASGEANGDDAGHTTAKVLASTTHPLIISVNHHLRGDLRADGRIRATSYHFGPALGGSLNQQIDQFLAKPDFSKPKILANDLFLNNCSPTPCTKTPLSANQLGNALLRLKNQHGFDGSIHFEHFDQQQNQYNGLTGSIGGLADFQTGTLARLTKLGQHATPLAAFGTLSTAGNKLRWQAPGSSSSQPITLVGFSLYGMLSQTRHNRAAYLDVLASKGVNFTREWVIDQWTSLALGSSTGWQTGLSPFAGPLPATNWKPYDLHKLRDAYFTELRDFVQAAWARGIVVQISIFDAHGLRRVPNNPNAHGRWIESPYNNANNAQPFLDLDCPTCEYSTSFLGQDGAPIGAINRSLVHRVVEELRGFGNVIYEVMNEPRAPLMANHAVADAWQGWVADVIRDAHANGPFTITLHPANRSVMDGDQASFSCAAGGGSGSGTFQYQWQYDAPAPGTLWVDLVDDMRWSGENSPSFVVHNTILGYNGFRLRCRVRDLRHPADGGEVFSGTATLNVSG